METLRNQDIENLDLMTVIEDYIEEFIEEKNIDRKKFSSMQWAACLMYIYRHLFKNNPVLLFTSSKNMYSYNIFKVNKVLDVYIYLCFTYNHRICIEHFCFLTGINRQTIYNWKLDNKTIYLSDSSNTSINNIYGSCKDSDSKYLYSDVNGSGEKATLRHSDIYYKLINNTMVAADDLMLTKHGVNSIAYRNIVSERYQKQTKAQNNLLDSSDLALQLGISDQLQLLPGD